MQFKVLLLEPANEFIDTLPIKMQSKVYRTIDIERALHLMHKVIQEDSKK